MNDTPMKILFLSSAMPVRFGSVRQRIAYAQRKALLDFAQVTTLVLDVWGTEWPARRHLREGDRFYGHARKGQVARLLEGAGNPVPSAVHAPDQLMQGWMSPARMARIAGWIEAASPDLVVSADPVISGVATAFLPPDTAVARLDDGSAHWARHMAASVRDPAEQSWFAQLAIAAEATGTSVRHGAAPRVVIEQEESDLFFEKSSTVLVPATGIPWLDRRILSVVADACTAIANARDESAVRVVLLGFDRQSARSLCPQAELQSDWTRLHTTLGIARALVLPYLTPALRPLVGAALSVGTPVLLRLSDKQHFGLASQEGLFAVLEEHVAAAFCELARAPLATPDYCRAISTRAHRLAPSSAQRQVDWAAWLSAVSGRGLAPSATPTPLPPARNVPLGAKPSVSYNPVTRMLMVQVEVQGWAKLEEVRLIDAHGREVTRLAPNAHQQAQTRYVIEGGVVTDLAPLGGALRIEGYCDVEPLFTCRIEVEEFKRVEAGVAVFSHDNGTLRATFWTTRESGDAPWEAQIGANRAVATPRPDCAIDDLGLDVWQVRMPVPAERTPLLAMSLIRDAGQAGTAEGHLPPQKIFEVPTGRTVAPASNLGLDRLKDIHKGRRAWIVGNGPSVRLDDLARIPKDDIVFCFNRFYLSYNDNPLRETYVVSADTLMIQDFGQEMIERSAGLPLFCIGPEQVAGLQGDFVRLPPGAASVPDFSFDPAHHVSVGGSSVFVALQMAWYMGLRDVALYGMDYSFSATLVRDPRYPFPVSFDEGNHFIKAYRSAKPWCPPTWRDISAGFLNARIAFETTGGTVVNATRGGLLETFRRADFETLVAR